MCPFLFLLPKSVAIPEQEKDVILFNTKALENRNIHWLNPDATHTLQSDQTSGLARKGLLEEGLPLHELADSQ